MTEITITDQNFDDKIAAAKGVILVDFWAPWCGPCRMLGPIIEEIAEGAEDFKVGKCNVDENSGTAGKFGIMSIPTVLVFKDGEVVERLVGVQDKASYLGAIKKTLS